MYTQMKGSTVLLISKAFSNYMHYVTNLTGQGYFKNKL